MSFITPKASFEGQGPLGIITELKWKAILTDVTLTKRLVQKKSMSGNPFLQSQMNSFEEQAQSMLNTTEMRELIKVKGQD